MTILTDVPSATARSQFSMMHRLHSLSTSTTTERRRRANNFYCTTIEDHTSISTRNEPSGTTVLYFNNFLQNTQKQRDHEQGDEENLDLDIKPKAKPKGKKKIKL